jgi:hypothetical protein
LSFCVTGSHIHRRSHGERRFSSSALVGFLDDRLNKLSNLDRSKAPEPHCVCGCLLRSIHRHKDYPVNTETERPYHHGAYPTRRSQRSWATSPHDSPNLDLPKAIESCWHGRRLPDTNLRHKGQALNLKPESVCHHRAYRPGDPTVNRNPTWNTVLPKSHGFASPPNATVSSCFRTNVPHQMSVPA